jgi:predicted transcriptional regulator of viral defense system
MSDTNNEKTVRKGLSSGESWLLSSLAEKRKNIFSLNDITLELSCPYERAKVIANRLVKKKWIIPLSRGKYLLVPLSAGVEGKYTEHEFVIASKLVNPYYIGYWSALNYYRFTEQTPLTVFVATTKRLRSRKILGTEYRFITLSKRKFFGFTRMAVANSTVNISEKEKTIADSLDHPEYCGGISEVAKCLWKARGEISLKRLVDVALKMGNSSILKRFGYLSEILGIELPENLASRITSSLRRGFSLLDPAAGGRGKYSTKWNLLVNVPVESLLEWRESH